MRILGKWVAGGIVAVLVATGVAFVAKGWIRPPMRPIAIATDLYERGDWAGAEAQAHAILAEHREDREALRILARASARLGRDDVARRIFQRLGVATMEPEDHLVLAIGLNREGRTNDARETLQFAIQDDRDHAESRYELAKIEVAQERWDEASKLVRVLLADPIWKVRAGVVLGVARGLANDPHGAMMALGEALKSDPDLRAAERSPLEARKLLTRAFLKTGMPDEAKAEAESILKTGADPEASWLLSRAELQRGELALAEAAMKASRGFNKDHPEAFEPARYVGAAKCAECHAEIDKAQQQSRHAETFRRGDALADLVVPSSPVDDPHVAGVSHVFRKEGTSLHVATTTPEGVKEAVVAYVLGSGNHGRSFVGKVGDEPAFRELRISQFAKDDRWDLTTGHAPLPADPHDVVGLRQIDDALRSCLGCHTTNPQAILTGTGPEALDRAIRCERCHGPGGNHVEAVTIGFADPAIGRPRLASASAVTNLCGQCHGAGIRDIPPGDEKMLLRFQSTTLPRSRCVTEAPGALSCVSCHDPHANAEKSPAFYEAKCLACHGEPPQKSRTPGTHPIALPKASKHVICPINPKVGCIGCHMPMKEGTMPHSSFTDHRIRVHRPTTPR